MAETLTVEVQELSLLLHLLPAAVAVLTLSLSAVVQMVVIPILSAKVMAAMFLR
jgi:hypothetical protein